MMLYRQLMTLLIFFLSMLAEVSPWCRQGSIKTNKQIKAMATSLAGRYLAIAHNDQYLRIYYGDSYGKAGEYFVGFDIAVVRFSNDGYYLAVGGASNTVLILNAYQPFALNATINPNVGSFVVGIDFGNSSSARFVVCGGNPTGSGKINIMNVIHTSPWTYAINMSTNLNPTSSNPNDCRISPFDGKIIVSTYGKLELYDSLLSSGSVMVWIANAGISFSKLAFSPITSSVIFIDSNGNLTYSLSLSNTNNSPVALSSLSTTSFTALDYSFTGKYMATGGTGKILYIYDSSKAVVARWDTSAPIKSISFNKHNQRKKLFVGDSSGQVLVLSFNCTLPRCGSDYYLDETGCKFCGDAISKCILCSNQTICERCVDGYFVNPNTFKCDVCPMLGCLTCNSAINCSQCQIGFYSIAISDLNICKRCNQAMQGCIICNSSDVCVACSNQYFLDSVTFPTSPKCKLCTSLANCVKCQSQTVCLECVTGFYKNSNICDACDSNCLYCDGSPTNCTQCAKGWYLTLPSSFLCARCPTGCLSCNNSNFCFQCQNNMYEKTDGTCAFCLFPCLMCEDATVCMVCAQGFFLYGNSCFQCSGNCATCNNLTQCLTCLPGYYLDANFCKICIDTFPQCEYCNSSVCQSCQLGYFLNSSSSCQLCIDQIFQCQKCFSDKICSSCTEGFFLTGLSGNSSCQTCKTGCQTCIDSVSCKKCFLQHFLDSNLDCLPCTGNCLQCSDSSACQICEIGYFLDGIACQPCRKNISNCVHCSNGSTCFDCEIGYFLDIPYNKCKKCSGNCQSCDTFGCNSCSLGFYLLLSNSSCESCSQACTECSENTCSSCKAGYFLDQGVCKNCNSNRHCLTCNFSTCFSCLNGYFLDIFSSNSITCTWCEAKIEGCLQCNSSNICTFCDFGYFLDPGSNLCTSCGIQNGCQKCLDSSTCLVCGLGYFLNSSGKCQSCQNGCSLCDPSGNCFSCSPGFYQNKAICVFCKSIIDGCNLCSSPTTCMQCMKGYYFDPRTSKCILCRKSLTGCLCCNGSEICIDCQSGFYLNTVSKKCETCHKSMPGCEVCLSQNVCLDCGAGYYLTNARCTLCSAITNGCMDCSEINTCLRCKTGFYLKNGTCQMCFTVNNGCQSCLAQTSSGITCIQCSSGYALDLTMSLCTPCGNIGCKFCDQNSPSLCITCDFGYYKNGTTCFKCNSVITGCNSCTSSNQCNICDIGYYLDTGMCKLCQDSISGCGKCALNTSGINQCAECKSSYVLDSLSNVCSSCSSVLEGCTYCLTHKACLACSNGYFKDQKNNLCKSCTHQQGCILCQNETKCDYCAASYFMDHKLFRCIKCSYVLQNCMTCFKSTRCLSCQIGYFFNQDGKCEQIMIRATNKPEGVKLITQFIDKENLSHTLMVANDQYSNPGHDLTGSCTLYLTDYNHLSKDQKIEQIKLIIKDIRWLSSSKIQFLTDNPTHLDSESINPQRRLLQQSLDLNLGKFKVSLQMNQKAINTILPNVYQTGDLVLDYSLDEPQFYTSYLKAQSAGSTAYTYFGAVICTLLIVNFSFKTYKLERDQSTHHHTGEILSHIFALKTIFLFHYPITKQFYYFCSGFMTVDLPWGNTHIGSVFGQQADLIPMKLAMYFYNLSIASTYLIALCIGITLFCLRFLINESKQFTRKKYSQLVYGIFIFGLTFAGSLSVQGAKLNPIQRITINSLFYIIGIVIFIGVLVKSVYSVCQNKQNFYKIRIFLKAILLSIGHFNPIILISLAIVLDILLVFLQFIVVENPVPWSKVWLFNNLLLDLVLALNFLLPNSLLSLFGSMTIVSVVTFIEILLNLKLMVYFEEKAKIKGSKETYPKIQDQKTKVGFTMNESLETFIDEKEYNKFDIWNVEYGNGQIGTLNEIAMQDQRVQTVKKNFQDNAQAIYYSFSKGMRPRPQQTEESMIQQNGNQQQDEYERQLNRHEYGRRQRRKLTTQQIEDRKKQLNPFRISSSSSSSPTDESAKSEEEKKRPNQVRSPNKNRQKKKEEPLS